MKKTFIIIFGLLLTLGTVSAALADGVYTHPSGAFSLTEFGALEEEVEDGALFVDGNALVMAVYGQATLEITEEYLASTVRMVLEGVTDFSNLELDEESIIVLENGYLIPYSYDPPGKYGAGEVFITNTEDTVYMLILAAKNYSAVEAAWLETVESFTIGVPVVEATPIIAKPKGVINVSDGIYSGFEPEINGFSFYNYGNDIPVTNLTAAELHRMFGDQVCASLSGGECTLTPPARQWMEQINGYMDGGHCEGMAVLSALMYYEQVDPLDFGGEVAAELAIEGNDPLQREIAYWWTTQATYPAAEVRVNESPSAVVQTLIEAFEEGPDASEWWVVGFYQPDGSEGHAVTPIGVTDEGDGFYNILIYDNNFPGETRAIEVDTNTETWQYEGSPNPEIESFLYTGSDEYQNLEVVAISPRLQTQVCDFCAGGGVPFAEGEGVSNALPKQAGPAQQATATPEPPKHPIWADLQKRWSLLIHGQADNFYQVWLKGKADLLIVDDWGRRLGYDQGEFVSEIAGGGAQNVRIFFQQPGAGLDKDKSPVFRVPVGLTFQIFVDGSLLEEADVSEVSMIGPGYYMNVPDIWLEPGEMDSIYVYTDENRHHLQYQTNYTESPGIEMGLETEEGSYAIVLQATELIGLEDTFDVILDMDTNEFIINTSYNTDPSTYQVLVQRIDEEGERIFGAADLVFDPDNTAYIPFTYLDPDSDTMVIDFDYENDGEIDESFELPDVTGEVDFYSEEE